VANIQGLAWNLMQGAILVQSTADINSVSGCRDDQEQISYEQGYHWYLQFSFTVITGGRLDSVGGNHTKELHGRR